MSRSILFFCFFLSLLLHLATLLSWWRWGQSEEDDQLFRARFARPLRFVEPLRLPALRPQLAAGRMEYVAPVVGGALPAAEPVEISSLPLADQALPQLGTTGGGALPKAGGPQLAVEERPSVAGPVYIDSAESEGLELLPLEVLARVDDKRAMVIPDPNSRQDLQGFINFTMLRLDGANSFVLDVETGAELGNPLESLARYIRDHTQILAQLRGVPQAHFLASELLKDPIHFLFPGRRFIESSEQRVRFSERELEMMGRYLRSGGFFFIDAGGGPDSRRFLNEMVGYLRRLFGGEARLGEVPLGHPLYHSFFDYPSGFPGEEKQAVSVNPFNTWLFPERIPDSSQPPRGLWGVELDGELVALISDLDLHLAWSGKASTESPEEEEEQASNEEEEGEAPSPITEPFLRAATNIVVYALTRSKGLTPRREVPTWRQSRPEVELATQPYTSQEELVDDTDLADGLEASLALVHIPPGSGMEGEVRLSLDEGNRIEVLRGKRHGVLVRNLVAGTRQLELEYGGFRRRIEVDLRGGQVLTVGVRLERPAFFQRLSLKPQPELVGVSEWLERFADLTIEEIFVDENPAESSFFKLPE